MRGRWRGGAVAACVREFGRGYGETPGSLGKPRKQYVFCLNSQKSLTRIFISLFSTKNRNNSLTIPIFLIIVYNDNLGLEPNSAYARSLASSC